MKKNRKRYDSKFKAAVALQAVHAAVSAGTLAKKYSIHENQVFRWKAQLHKHAHACFERNAPVSQELADANTKISSLEQTIDALTGQVEFLKHAAVSGASAQDRCKLVDAAHGLSITQQCELLEIPRSTYYVQAGISAREQQDFEDLLRIVEVMEELPFYGYRKISRHLLPEYPHLTRKRVRRLMHRSGLRAIFPKHRTTKPRKDHHKYPYLLREKIIRYPNQVWASDVTYIKLGGGFVYLVIIVDLYSRKILSWRLSNSLDASFCVEALTEALETFGVPAIMQTDQGAQYTSDAFIEVLKVHQVEISMNGKGRALDNVFVERLFRTLKYENIYLYAYENMNELKQGLKKYVTFYNTKRYHQSLEYRTPEELYESFSIRKVLAIAV